MKWKWLPFAELTAKAVYDVLQLREAVFHIEQGCVYRDLDDLDIQARHLLGYHQDQLICYLRVCLQNENLIIARVVVAKPFRRRGLGKVMIKNTLQTLQQNYPGYGVVLSAQLSQQEFYRSLGFAKCSQPFDDAGIMHIKMEHVATV